jgi:hypothetical protein
MRDRAASKTGQQKTTPRRTEVARRFRLIPLRKAYSRIAAWTVAIAALLFIEEDPIVFLPAVAVLAIGWWIVQRLD